jgi:hypothetical protein
MASDFGRVLNILFRSPSILLVLVLATFAAALTTTAKATPVPVTAREGTQPPLASSRIRASHFAEDTCTLIADEAGLSDISAEFIARLIWTESRFNPAAVSPKGAQGIAQFMPGTAVLRQLADPFEPVSALVASIRYLAELRTRYGNLGLAAAAYNAGEQRVENLIARGGGSMPYETEDYVFKITGRTIADWLGAKDEKPKPVHAKLPFTSACRKMVEKRKAPTLLVAATPSAPRQPWGAQVYESFSRAQAVSHFRNLQKRHPDIFGAGPPLIVPVVNYSMGRRLRHAVFVGTQTRNAADRKCAEMRRSGVACLVLSTDL